MWLLWHVTAAVDVAMAVAVSLTVDVSTVSVAAVTVDMAVVVHIILIIIYPYIIVLYWGPYHPRLFGTASIKHSTLWIFILCDCLNTHFHSNAGVWVPWIL